MSEMKCGYDIYIFKLYQYCTVSNRNTCIIFSKHLFIHCSAYYYYYNKTQKNVVVVFDK